METESGIDEKTYRAIVSVVDRRRREIRVTRKDFDALTSAVTGLAQARKRTEERLDRLSAKVEQLADNMDALNREMRNLARQVGALAENIGFGLEDIARGVLPGYLYGHLGIEMGEFERRFL